MLSKKRFEALRSEGFTRIPLVREVQLNQLITPPEIYQKFSGPYTYLLESAESNKRWGRYSFIGLSSPQRIEVYGNTLRVLEGSVCLEETQCRDPLQWIDAYLAKNRVSPDMPKFSGGLVGYFGYECSSYIEPRLQDMMFLNKQDDLAVPDILLLVSQEVAVLDSKKQSIELIVCADASAANAYTQAEERLDQIEALLKNAPPADNKNTVTQIDESSFSSQFGTENYCAAVDKAREYIAAGDVMQVVVSQRLSVPFDGDPFACYCTLRNINPSPYMYYFHFDHFHVVGSSPEVLVRVEEHEATVRPIAGTRPRGDDEAKNKHLEQDLCQDEKELAEHLMLIDLGRNDLGRVCQVGSVEVVEKMVLERYSHVVHLVSRVVGQVRDGVSLMDVLRATFPAGTVSGAPKIRAMELIGEFETIKRGIYSGAVGYLSWGGAMDLAIAIRTLIVCNQILYAQAGAGLVYDSKPMQEWEETMSKARVLMRAAQIASTHSPHAAGWIMDN